ncbi:DUF4328 domain-containing protein [Kitasatospora sp. NPDC002227]|uniref:DUF4328 domain-containing protein n=1 Tax=Kitasatospora sp. NPDC002227 TaxID=3154773 RepID=UPI00331ED655
MAKPAVYRSPRSAAVAACILLAVCGAATVLELIADLKLFRMADDAITDLSSVDLAAADDADHFAQLASVVSLVALIASGVTFITWFHRARVNAEAFDYGRQQRGRGWAIGGWFVPFMALWVPRQIAGDIWWSSGRPDGNGVPQPASPALLNFWWAAFMGGNILGQVGARLGGKATDMESFRTGAALEAAGDALMIVAAVLAVLVVRKVTAMQEAKHAELAAQAYGRPAGAVHA